MIDTREFYSKLMSDMSVHYYGFLGLKVFVMYEESIPFDEKKSLQLTELVPKCLYEFGMAVTPW